MSSSMVIRNLTSTLIFIKRMEQFEDTTTQQSKPSGFFFAAKDSTSPTPLAPRLGSDGNALQFLDLGIVLASFESCTLDQAGSINDRQTELPGTNIALRLTIEDAQGHEHHITAHPYYTQKHSTTSTSPSTPSSLQPTYTALFHPTTPTPHLTIHTNHARDYRSWMSTLPDSLPLSALSIPGTHNSHTCYRALPSVRCQGVDVSAQLSHGIRYLDIRLQPVSVAKKELVLVHGAFPISLTGPKYFAPIIQACNDFLDKWPSETILISLKREGIGAGTDGDLARILSTYYYSTAEHGKSEKWWLGSSLPTLGEVRGKMVLVRRYKAHGKERVGLDATGWPNSPSHALFPKSLPITETETGTETETESENQPATFSLQDFCDVMHPSAIKLKVQYANDHLVRAAACAYTPDIVGPLYLNYLSASNFWNKACWPEKIAAILNRSMEEWLCVGHGLEDAPAGTGEPGLVEGDGAGGKGRGKVRRKARGDGGTGVVVMDFVGDGGDWEVVRLVVGMNFMNLGLWMMKGVER